ncbi:MAG: cbb3-type cytochrome oxidase subunit 3 [Steroidobacteraceae bacterium]
MSILRGLLTLILMFSFITLVVWLYAKRHKHAYDYAARLPLESDDMASDETLTADHHDKSDQP